MEITEFTVAPQINAVSKSLPYHEWFIEFKKTPENLLEISSILDEQIQNQNIYYKDLIVGKVLRTLKITPLKAGAFRSYMDSIGKLGGQNKVPRLSDNREIANKLSKYTL